MVDKIRAHPLCPKPRLFLQKPRPVVSVGGSEADSARSSLSRGLERVWRAEHETDKLCGLKLEKTAVRKLDQTGKEKDVTEHQCLDLRRSR